MNLSLFIAHRYLFAKKSQNVINYISAISVVGIVIGTMSMIIVLSALNGFDALMTSLYSTFDPEIKIESLKGKTFEFTSEHQNILTTTQGINSFSKILEDDALLVNKKHQHFVKIKGCDETFTQVCNIDSRITNGVYLNYETDEYQGIVGTGTSIYLQLQKQVPSDILVYAPIKSERILTPDRAFRRRSISITGIYDIEEESNSNYMLTTLSTAQDLFGTSEISAIEIKLNNTISSKKTINKLKSAFGSDYSIKTLREQKETFFKVAQTEKWAIVFILSFILFISSFNIVGSLSMLIIEKQKDISFLKYIGASNNLITKIFKIEGWLISWIGAIIGLLLGWLVCCLQIKYGIVKIANSGNFLFQAYPISMRVSDFLLTGAIVLIIGWITSQIPSKILIDKYTHS